MSKCGLFRALTDVSILVLLVLKITGVITYDLGTSSLLLLVVIFRLCETISKDKVVDTNK